VRTNTEFAVALAQQVIKSLNPSFSAFQNASPTLPISLLQSGVNATTTVITEGLKRYAETAGKAAGRIPILGGIFQAMGDLASIGVGFVSRGVEMQYQDAQRLGNLERPREIVRNLGGAGTLASLREGASKGFMPEEALGMQRAFLATVGHKDAGKALARSDIFGATLAGLNPGALAGFAALGTPGGGSRYDVGDTARVLQAVLGVAERQFGFRGAKTEELLGRLVSATQGMAEQGLSVDLFGATTFMSKLGNTSLSNGAQPFQGMNAARVTGKMMGLGTGAANGLAGGFGGLSEAAIQSWAYSQTNDPLEAIALMQQAAGNPEMIQAIVRSQLGDQAAAFAFVGSGFNANEARGLAGPLARGNGAAAAAGGRSGGNQPISALQAGHTLSRVSAAEERGNAEKMITMVHNIENMLLKLGDKADWWMDTIADLIQKATNAMGP
jgi:hypothetical protein